MADSTSKNPVFNVLEAIGLKQDKLVSNLKRDEELVFFNTTAWLDTRTQYWHIPIHGWVYEPQPNRAIRTLVSGLLERKYGLVPTPNNKESFKQRLNLFTVDNEHRKRIIINLAGQLYELPSSARNGQFEGIIKLPKTAIKTNKDGRINFNAILKAKDKRRFSGSVSFIQPQGVSVISDIDDTVKLSYIHDRKRMFDATFFQEFEPVKGMPDLYQKWATQGASFHFVSSSPWQLYQPLIDFMEKSHFPWASLSLKKVRIKDETFLNLFKSGLVTKPVAINAILKRYPDRKFILVGDSGEQDAQVYAAIAKQHPTQIAKIYIRNVHADNTLNQRYKTIFDGLNRRLWTTFVYPSQIKLDISTLM